VPIALRPNGASLLLLDDNVRPLVFSPDGKYLAVCDGEVSFWDTTTRRRIATLEGVPRPLAFSPEGRLVALGDYKGKVELRELCSLRTLFSWQAHPASTRDLTFTAAGRRLVTGSADQTALVWDLFGLEPKEKRNLATPEEAEEVWKDLAAASEKAWHAWRVLRNAGDQGWRCWPSG